MKSSRPLPITFEELPGWSFAIDEISAGAFRASGEDKAGRSVEAAGVDPERLLRECKEYAARMLAGT